MAFEPMRRNRNINAVAGFQGFERGFCSGRGVYLFGREVGDVVVGRVVVVDGDEVWVLLLLGRRDFGRRVVQNVGVARRGRVL